MRLQIVCPRRCLVALFTFVSISYFCLSFSVRVVWILWLWSIEPVSSQRENPSKTTRPSSRIKVESSWRYLLPPPMMYVFYHTVGCVLEINCIYYKAVFAFVCFSPHCCLCVGSCWSNGVGRMPGRSLGSQIFPFCARRYRIIISPRCHVISLCWGPYWIIIMSLSIISPCWSFHLIFL